MAKDALKFKEHASDFVNCFNPESEKFVRLMAAEHRTIQQAFTKLCLQWLEKVADEDYQTDGRNAASHVLALQMLVAWKGIQDLNQDMKPSQMLPMI